ncbi:hypothetical protein [Nostoc flagelliforme]|uniref:hypothetical protein n=1 Tax=Nostoc flagelliforme TaxID=1306274 RepID=UPI001F554826|nr:hypothetical protein [Nostoc flagelliforme]
MLIVDDRWENRTVIIQSMQAGTDCVTEIVSYLNNFSRHRETDKKLANLHQGLESTLLILGHRFKYNAHSPAIELGYLNPN